MTEWVTYLERMRFFGRDTNEGPAFTPGKTSFESDKYDQVGDLLHQIQTCGARLAADAPKITWILKMSKAHIPDDLRVEEGCVLDPDKLENITLLCHYTLAEPTEA